jgi:hypothetical protein
MKQHGWDDHPSDPDAVDGQNLAPLHLEYSIVEYSIVSNTKYC